MATKKKTDLDDDLERLYRRPPGEFIAARNELAKQVAKRDGKAEAEKVRASPKPTPSAWAVNALFEHEAERMDALLAAGERARAGQKEAVAGRGAESLRSGLETARKLAEELRRRGAALLKEAGVALSKTTSERLGTNLQSLAFSPAAEAEAARRWLDRDLDPPGFEVLAGLQLAGSPVVDFAARKAQREAKKEEKPAPERKLHAVPKPAPAKPARDEEERKRREAAERAQAEREAERRRRRIAVAEEKLERARKEAAAAKDEVAQAQKAAAEARRRAEAAEAAAQRAEEKAGRAAERVERAEDELKGAKEGK
jgi:DNA polymerase III gamma/tau subunit